MFQPKPLSHSLLACTLALALVPACAEDDPDPVASNCDDPDGCLATQQPLERIDAVDILLVVDNSSSAHLDAFKRELPRLVNALVNGGEEDARFPAAASVHVAVATSDMGLPGIEGIHQCYGLGDDGIFIKPAEGELSCEVSHPGYLAFDGGPAPVATVENVSCLPMLEDRGCGFEQPLEAMLKALWPASNPAVSFLADADGNGMLGHGEDENEGFLRDDSLLVVVVVTDEDDSSAISNRIFVPASVLDPSNPSDAELAMQGLNVRAALNQDDLYNVGRYIAGLKALRPEHPDRVVFATIAGIPPDLLPPTGRELSEIEDDEERDEAYAELLADPRMQIEIESNGTPDRLDDTLASSCEGQPGNEFETRRAFAPVRLVQVARGFGRQGVLGSVCNDDFGASAGMLLRAIGTRLTEAASTPPDAGSDD